MKELPARFRRLADSFENPTEGGWWIPSAEGAWFTPTEQEWKAFAATGEDVHIPPQFEIPAPREED
jgi:hypothetical protein